MPLIAVFLNFAYNLEKRHKKVPKYYRAGKFTLLTLVHECLGKVCFQMPCNRLVSVKLQACLCTCVKCAWMLTGYDRPQRPKWVGSVGHNMLILF